MKTVRKFVAIGMCGVMLGGLMSVMGAAPATARSWSSCDKKIDNMEASATRDYDKGKISAADYDKVMAEVAFHREIWGC